MYVNVRVVRDAATGREIARDSFIQKKAMLFSGIGNPESFARTVRKLEIVIVGHKVFRDHHWYSEHDVQTIMADPAVRKAELLMTTEKDFIRLRGRSDMFSAVNLPVMIVEIEQRILYGNEIIDSLIQYIG